MKEKKINIFVKMISKEKVQVQLEQLGDEFSIDELIDRLLLIEKIEKGVAQSKQNQVISESDLDEKIKEW